MKKLRNVQIVNTEDIYRANWLAIRKTTYLDKNGVEREWEFTVRVKNPKVVTIICKSKETGEYLLIKQPRVPLDAEQIEFPAGLIDQGETIKEAALRELKEETGFSGEIISVSELLPKSAGLTDEATYLIFCSVNKSKKGNTKLGNSEEITSFWVTPDEFIKLIKSEQNKRTRVSYDVYSFMMGALNERLFKF